MNPNQPEKIAKSNLTAADVTHARREAFLVLLVWILATSYSIFYYAKFGYKAHAHGLRFVLGFPDWIFWGIITPWLVCSVFSIWFATFYMRDYDWGDEDQADPDEAF